MRNRFDGGSVMFALFIGAFIYAKAHGPINDGVSSLVHRISAAAKAFTEPDPPTVQTAMPLGRFPLSTSPSLTMSRPFDWTLRNEPGSPFTAGQSSIMGPKLGSASFSLTRNASEPGPTSHPTLLDLCENPPSDGDHCSEQSTDSVP